MSTFQECGNGAQMWFIPVIMVQLLGRRESDFAGNVVYFLRSTERSQNKQMRSGPCVSKLLHLNTFLFLTFPSRKENVAWTVVFYYTRTFLYTLFEQRRLFEAVIQGILVCTPWCCFGMLFLLHKQALPSGGEFSLAWSKEFPSAVTHLGDMS